MNTLNKILSTYSDRNVQKVFFIGLFCGLPFLLTTSILDVWLKEYGVSKTIIGFFALLHCPYTLKFLWGPIFEKVPIPYLTKKIGQHKSWAILSQIILIASIVGIACYAPENLTHVMTFSVLCALAGGCQDVTLYSFLLNSAKKDDLGIIASVVNIGFKIGMFIAKSSTLYIAHYVSWKAAYLTMAGALIFGIIFVLIANEPTVKATKDDKKIQKLTGLLKCKLAVKPKAISKLELVLFECFSCPTKLFVRNKNWQLYLLLIMLYRIGDIMIVKMGKIFYLEVGFSTLDIANAVQVFGAVSSLLGGLVGGYLIKSSGLKKCMLFASVIHAIVGLSLISLVYTGKNYFVLYSVVFVEFTTGAAMSSCFVAFLYSLCNAGSKSTQFALLWAFHEGIATLIRVFAGGFSDIVGWTTFFITASFLFIPGIAIIILLMKKEKTYESTGI